MNGAGKRVKKKTIKVEDGIKMPRRWKDHEMKELLDCIMQHGHKNLDKIQERVPSRSLEVIRIFMRTIHDTAGKLSEKHPELDGWIQMCNKAPDSSWKDSIQIAQAIKYLSVDGLVENHPLPDRCQGINFPEAYRVIYQALLGYPIQPVNEETANFIQQTLNELKLELKQESGAIEKVSAFLAKRNKSEEENIKTVEEESSEKKYFKKPLKVYQRKTNLNQPTTDAKTPSLKIVVEANTNKEMDSEMTKNFSVTIHGDSKRPTVVNVPVPMFTSPQLTANKDEQELLKSQTYNPFEVPEKWLQEPIYLNLTKNT